MNAMLELAERCEAAEAETKELFLLAWDAALGFNARSIRSGSPYQRFLACMEIGAWLDAAMSLVPEDAYIRAHIAPDGISDILVHGTQATGATPALALCAAALKARAHA